MNLFPQILDFALGEGCYVDVLQHPEHVTGQTPAKVFLHGGGGIGGDRRAIWPDGGSMNRFATHLFQSEESAFDVISLGLPQETNQAPTNAPHLSPIVRTPVGVHFPESFARLNYALQRIQEEFQPSGIILAGCSYGAIISGVQMMRSSLPIQGLIGYYLIPDVRASGGVDSVHFSMVQGLFGTTTQSAWNAIPVAAKREASFLWYLERGLIANAKPIYLVFDRVGDHIKPYGDPARPGSAPHDASQFATVRDALVAAGLPHQAELLPGRGAWEKPEFGDPLSQRVESWMIDLV